ncbi:ubiquitin carboxyl-terminal hydrolase 32-like isoform X2 [Portunus trituberculatus]|uniref:ubiquitin carboxyl-terminal hydrolase 32-like isoform X2 n=1 Tax=Portunus trituberculatus TaxID=210409 RepID=UPI001E1CC3A3|nr:ubiquitin carboxyl-terminal hydrolase 32-like isoform X2 [Portunus trituberculatus]
MGGKESKPISLSYEEAMKRVSDGEFTRLKDAYKRTATLNGAITKQAFIREVLGDGVPLQLAELVFLACGGTTKGITFKDLLCSLVLLTRGNKEEKIKFIFGLYANESGTHVVRSDMLRQLQATEGGYTPEILHKCFGQSERISYEEFKEWLLSYPDATTVTRWLLAEPCHVSLSNDLETPTFYQTLAGVTHLEEKDILELEKRYWILKGSSPSGKLDPDTLVPMISPPLPPMLAKGVFNAFDENRDNHIDFKEMACGISAACRGPQTERQKFCFKIFDRDRDGRLSHDELTAMIQALLLLRDEEQEKGSDDVCVGVSPEHVQKQVKDLLSHHDPTNSGSITQEEYLMWTLHNPLSTALLDIIFQVCHIVLGLKPSSRAEEGEIVLGWLRRAEAKSLTIGQFWYIINMEWWGLWHDYVSHQSPGSESSSLSPSSHSSSPANSQCGSLKRTKLQKKSANSEGTVASDVNSTVFVTSIASLGGADSLSLSSLENDVPGRCDQSGSRQMTHPRHGPVSSSPRKNFSSSSLSVFNYEANRCSSASSPSHSPRLTRRVATSPGALQVPSRPPAIDNSPLVETNTAKVTLLTGEGGRLKRNVPLVEGRDFVLVPDSLWKALQQWYGGAPALPRQVIHGRCSGEVELELYPLTLRLFRHVQQQTRSPNNSWVGVVGGYGAAALNSAPYYVTSLPNSSISSPKRYLAYLAAFSRLATLRQVYDYLATKLRLRVEDMRLWYVREEPAGMILLEEDDATLEEVGVADLAQVLIEVRNKDLTWPEEMSQITSTRVMHTQSSQGLKEKGVTGLNNLGNTCFLNAALQCCSNTSPLTTYFIKNMHLYELNPDNPCGMKGHMARQYGNLMQELWAGGARTVAPLKLRWTIGKYSGNFTGFQQHDSQELLAFLLDGLHEDLNRVHNKPYIELKDSEGRPDTLVAQEAWENHILRNKSIIVDLFHGQLKSKVTCRVCGNESARFDPFTYLTLQLPMESFVHFEVIVVRLDGSVPVKYGLRLNSDSRYYDVKQHLHILTSIPPHQIMLSDVSNAQIKYIPMDEGRVRALSGNVLFAYELPSPTSNHPSELRSATRSAKDRHVFTHIQRSTHHSSPCLREAINSPTASVGTIESVISSPNTLEYTSSGSSLHSSQPPSNTDQNSCKILDHKDSNSSLVSSTSSELAASSLSSSIQHDNDLYNAQKGFIIAFHRKMMRQEVYFLSSQKTKPSLFGLPLVIPCSTVTTQQDLYQAVWTQVSRLVSPLPPTEAPGPNHAHDCDDSLGYEFPFVLRAVEREGLQCAWCPWYKFCRGCQLPCEDKMFPQNAAFLAIDWDPTALHLRYQSGLERVFMEHSSVEEMRRKHVEPIALSDCLEAFCSEEVLDYSCDKCQKVQQAAKKLQIWRLPPVLIVHLKRFQFVGNKWIKSQKIVNFPLKDFDPTEYLASVPRQTIYMHRAELEGVDPAVYLANLPDKDNVLLDIVPENKIIEHIKGSYDDDSSGRSGKPSLNGSVNGSILSGGTSLCPSTTHEGSLGSSDFGSKRRIRNGSVLYGDTLQDFHQHRLEEGYDPLDLKYSLYAIACHTGIMEGGHYVCYAKNPQGKWICFNDSSCKEVNESQIDLNSAYMLFYQREGLSVEKYMPNVDGKVPFPKELDEESEAEYKKQCTVM